MLESEGGGRNGYVPNAVGTCGALLHLDTASTIVTLEVDWLLKMLQTEGGGLD